jgi:MFS family permease
MGTPRQVLPVTLLVILAGSAVYFAGSVAAPGLAVMWGLSDQASAWLTSTVQLGFVAGTLLAVGLDLPDRFRPSRLLAVLLIAAAVCNVLIIMAPSAWAVFVLRFLVGAFSGPVYPIGMRLLATWYPRLGLRLGLLLGAYTFGLGVTAILQSLRLDWQSALLGSSVVALLGALVAVVAVVTGPLLPARTALDVRAALRSFRVGTYRRSAVSYFGHMWELFAFWGLLPFFLAAAGFAGLSLDLVVMGAFLAGGTGCIIGGIVSRWAGEAVVARAALAISGLLCLASPWLFAAPDWLLVVAVLVWGAAAVADSPMFSALSSHAAPRGYVGAALTVQNSIGFLIPVVPLTLVPVVASWFGWQYAFVVLAVGPVLVFPFCHRLVRDSS